MQNAMLDETQTGIKVDNRNINSLRYADDTTLIYGRKQRGTKEPLDEDEEESELKLNIKKRKIMTSGPITSWRIDGETMETVTDFILGDSKITGNRD